MTIPNYTIKFNVMTVLILSCLVGFALGAIIICLTNNNVLVETFQNNISQPANYNQYAALKGIVGGQVPLPDNQLNFFYANKFDGSCCTKPQQYSSSTGCACISEEQMKYLNQRGGNNTEGGNNID